MARALSAAKTWPYVLLEDLDLPESERTTWLLRAITDEQREKFIDRFAALQKHPQQASKLFAEVLRAGLAGWTNYKDDEGNDMPFDAGENGRITDDSLALVRFPYRAELAEQIVQQNLLTDDDRKNLRSRQQQPSAGSPSTAASAT